MENYIVIILIIVVFVISAAGRTGNKAAPGEKKPAPAAPNAGLNIIEQFLMQQTTPHPAGNTAEEMEITDAPPNNPPHTFTAGEEGGSIQKNQVKNTEPGRKKTTGAAGHRQFSLKKAVINSEILNRKYI